MATQKSPAMAALLSCVPTLGNFLHSGNVVLSRKFGVFSPRKNITEEALLLSQLLSVWAAWLLTATEVARVCKVIHSQGRQVHTARPGEVGCFRFPDKPITLARHHKELWQAHMALAESCDFLLQLFNHLTTIWETSEHTSFSLSFLFFHFFLFYHFYLLLLLFPFYALRSFYMSYWIWQPATVDTGELEETSNHITLLFWSDWKLPDTVEISSFSSASFISESSSTNLVQYKGERGKVSSFQLPENIALSPLPPEWKTSHCFRAWLCLQITRSWLQLEEPAAASEQKVQQLGKQCSTPNCEPCWRIGPQNLVA